MQCYMLTWAFRLVHSSLVEWSAVECKDKPSPASSPKVEEHSEHSLSS